MSSERVFKKLKIGPRAVQRNKLVVAAGGEMVEHQRRGLFACAALTEDENANIRVAGEFLDDATDFGHCGAVAGQRRTGQCAMAAHERLLVGRPGLRPLAACDMPDCRPENRIVVQSTVRVTRSIQQRRVCLHGFRQPVLHAEAGADGLLQRDIPNVR